MPFDEPRAKKKANWQKKTEGGRGRKCLTGSEVRLVNEKETVEEKTSLGVRNVLKMILRQITMILVVSVRII